MKSQKLIKYLFMAIIMILMVDSMPRKGVGDDTALFLNPSTNAPPPAVAILLDTSGSMTSLPCAVPDGEDSCGVNSNNNSTYFVNQLGYDPNTDYGYSLNNQTGFDCATNNPPGNIDPGGEGCFYGGTLTGSSTEGANPNSFPTGSHVYVNGYFNPPLPSYCRQVKTQGTGGNIPSYWYDCGTINYFCSHLQTCTYGGFGGTSCSNVSQATKNACVPQLTGDGYWYGGTDGNGDFSYYSGNFLDFYPPKFVVTRKVMSDLITYNSDQYTNGRGVRFGIFSFTDNGAQTDVKIYPPCSDLGKNPTPGDYLNTLYSLTWNHSTPLAGALIQVGGYFANNSTWYQNLACNGNNYCGLPAGANLGSACSSDDSWCGCYNTNITCEKNYVIVMTDGNENTGPNGLQNWPAGNYLADKDNSCGTSGTQSCCPSAPGGVCNIDEVAGFLNVNSIRPTTQSACTTNIDTYTIGFAGTSGDGQQLNTYALQRAAQLGGGQFANAQNWQSLESALYTFFGNIVKKNRTFGTPNLPQLVTEGGGNTGTSYFKAFVAAFLPKDQNFWVGHLREYTGAAFTQTGNIQLFDKNGAPFSGNTSVQGQCSFSEYIPPPIWDAGADLSDTTLPTCSAPDNISANAPPCYLAPDKRLIYTVTPYLLSGFTINTNTVDGVTVTRLSNGTDAALTSTQQFTTTNTNLTPSDFGLAAGDITTMTNLMNYVIGPKANGVDVLGDIFHSDPTLVSTDSVRNEDLFDLQQLIPTGTLEYQTFLNKIYDKPEIVVAGANDGMIHAFYAGTYTGGAEFDRNDNYIPNSGAKFDYGTGQEVWAFIPYDLLPKLQYMYDPALVPTTTTGQYWTTEGIYTTTSTNHVYYVDASPYIRDVYLPGIDNGLGLSGPASYWHTILIIGERLGGTYYICLDITNRLHPKFMWEFTTGDMGFTFGKVAPQPPPIGPVWLSFDPDNDGSVSPPQVRWVTMLNGGWDPSVTTTGETNRGRAFYMVDIATGKLLWKFDESDNPDMKYPTPASPANVGPPDSTSRWVMESFMPDLGGQMWQFSFVPKSSAPGTWGGELDPGTGLVRTCISTGDTNCFMGHRLFSVQDPPPAQAQSQQIYYMSSATWDYCSVPNLWLGFAAGDRDNPLSCTPVNYAGALMAADPYSSVFMTAANLQLITDPSIGTSALPTCTGYHPVGWALALNDFTGTADGAKCISIPDVGSNDRQYFSIFTPDQNACIGTSSGSFSCNSLGGTGVVVGLTLFPVIGGQAAPGQLVSFASTGSGIPSTPIPVTSIFGTGGGGSITSTTTTPPNPFSIPICGGGAGTSASNTQMIVATSESGLLNLGNIAGVNQLMYPYFQLCIPQNVEENLVNQNNTWSQHRYFSSTTE